MVPELDGLTRQDIARIRGAAEANTQRGPIRSTDVLPGKKVGKPVFKPGGPVGTPKSKRGRRG